jgi:NAD(P)-dependent dehydrogenase (short-subunit alcohol dehydrogenase family)
MSPRIALVTGAAKGIGRAISQRLAKDGYNVAINDIPAQSPMLATLRDELAEKYPKQHHIIVPADVSSENEVGRMFTKVTKDLGGLDVVHVFAKV